MKSRVFGHPIQVPELLKASHIHGFKHNSGTIKLCGGVSKTLGPLKKCYLWRWNTENSAVINSNSLPYAFGHGSVAWLQDKEWWLGTGLSTAAVNPVMFRSVSILTCN